MFMQEPELVNAIIQERLRQAAEDGRRNQARAARKERASPRNVFSLLRSANASRRSSVALGSRTL